MDQPLADAISTEDARRIYDWLGARHDMGARFERAAKKRALQLLALRPGHKVLHAGVGTGKEHLTIQQAVGPTAIALGIDISATMLALTRERLTSYNSPALTMADIRRLPLLASQFDRVFCAYVLDLIPSSEHTMILGEFRRVLKSNGKLVTVSLTDGKTAASRTLIQLWKLFYRISPIALGGCRPVQMSHALLKSGFTGVQRELIIQLGMPSEVLVATRD